MSIVLHRHREDEHLLLAPATTTGPVEIPRGIAPARLGCEPGTSREVLDKLMEFAEREETRRAAVETPATQTNPAALIEHALHMATAPIEALLAEPARDWDFAERLLGVEARASVYLSRLTGDLTRTLNYHEHALNQPIIGAQRELLDVADFVVMDAVRIRQAFVAVAAATEDALVDVVAEWILAGLEETGAEAAA